MPDPQFDALMLAIALLASVVGMGWLALAMDTHWQQVFGHDGRTASRATLLRALGIAALGASLGLCLTVDHASMASLVWVMGAAGAAMTVAFTLSWRAAWLRWLAPWWRAGATRGRP